MLSHCSILYTCLEIQYIVESFSLSNYFQIFNLVKGVSIFRLFFNCWFHLGSHSRSFVSRVFTVGFFFLLSVSIKCRQFKINYFIATSFFPLLSLINLLCFLSMALITRIYRSIAFFVVDTSTLIILKICIVYKARSW